MAVVVITCIVRFSHMLLLVEIYSQYPPILMDDRIAIRIYALTGNHGLMSGSEESANIVP